jgi:hypothetical protein
LLNRQEQQHYVRGIWMGNFRDILSGRFSHTGSAGRSPSARLNQPATVFDFPSRLARGRAHV